ncbi:MAG: HAMP domain-containing protein [Acidobacteriota bacterium]
METTGLLARGEMPQSIEIHGHDEIGHLAEAFNEMAAALHRRFRQQMSEKPFRPIRPNPFIFGNPIKTERMFYGRQAELELARKLLVRATGGLVIVYYGDRRSGKTSILYQIDNGALGTQFLPIFVDLQALAASRFEDEFYESLAFEISDAVADEEGIGALSWDRSEGGGAPAFRSFMRELVQQAAPRRIVILFDEYETFDTLIHNGHLSPQTVPFFASFTETEPPVSFIFSGSDSLENDDAAHCASLFAKSHAIRIGFLQRDDASRLIREPVHELVDYDVGVTSGMLRLTGGQPYYTQAVCQSLVDHLNRVRRNVCEARDLTNVVDELVSNPPPQMIYFWRQRNSTEKLTLSLLADLLEDPMASATAEAIVAQRGKYPEGEEVSALVAGRILEHFVGEEFLESDESDGCRFRMDLFRRWIRRSHSMWRVLREEIQAK